MFNLSTITPDGLDYFNDFFIIITIISVTIQVLYMIFPQRLKSYFDQMDYKPLHISFISVSFTGLLSFIFLILMTLFMLQLRSASAVTKVSDELETSTDKQYRHRNEWMIESYFYMCCLNGSIWITLNGTMKFSRKTRSALEKASFIINPEEEPVLESKLY